MRRALLAFLALLAYPARAHAARDCRPDSADLPLRCAWGYFTFSPAGLLVPVGEVHRSLGDNPRLGYAVGAGVGVFRSFRYLGIAGGLRFGYGFTRQRFDTFDAYHYYAHVGPELRLGVATDRLFVHGLVRTGFTRWHAADPARTSVDAPDDLRFAHVGGGGGIWARLGNRFLFGGEIAIDRLIDGFRGTRPMVFSLVLGMWL